MFFGILHCIALASHIAAVSGSMAGGGDRRGRGGAGYWFSPTVFQCPPGFGLGLSTVTPSSNYYWPRLPWLGAMLAGIGAAKSRAFWLVAGVYPSQADAGSRKDNASKQSNLAGVRWPGLNWPGRHSLCFICCISRFFSQVSLALALIFGRRRRRNRRLCRGLRGEAPPQRRRAGKLQKRLRLHGDAGESGQRLLSTVPDDAERSRRIWRHRSRLFRQRALAARSPYEVGIRRRFRPAPEPRGGGGLHFGNFSGYLLLALKRIKRAAWRAAWFDPGRPRNLKISNCAQSSVQRVGRGRYITVAAEPSKAAHTTFSHTAPLTGGFQTFLQLAFAHRERRKASLISRSRASAPASVSSRRRSCSSKSNWRNTVSLSSSSMPWRSARLSCPLRSSIVGTGHFGKAHRLRPQHGGLG